MPGLATMDPGTSINFDGQAIQDQDEEDLRREEQEQQNQLKQLLVNAFDDLIDDDDDSTSVSSRELSHNSTASAEAIEAEQMESQSSIAERMSQSQSSSRPSLTPNRHGLNNMNYHHSNNMVNGGEHIDQQQAWNQQQHAPSPFSASPYGPHGGEFIYPTPEGAAYHPHDNYPGHMVASPHEHFYGGGGGIHPQYTSPSYPGYYGYHGDGQQYVDGYQQHYHPHNMDYHHHLPQQPPQGGDSQGCSPHHSPQLSPRLGNSQQMSPQSVGSDQYNNTVRYVKTTDDAPELELSQHSEQTDHRKQYHEHTGSPDGRQFTQLQILYKARGRQVDELTQALDVLKEESAREQRLLKHKLALSDSEKSGLSTTLEQMQVVIQQAKDESANLRTSLKSLDNEIVTLRKDNEEMRQKLHSAETMIESLNKQLLHVGHSDTLAKARSQHNTMLANLQQKYENELYHVKEKLDDSNNSLDEKREEIKSLRQQLNTIIKSSESSSVDRSETVNRLTKSLEESQQKCRRLLEAGACDEVNNLAVQLQRANASKALTDDLCHDLQEELAGLKEQLNMYESASRYLGNCTPCDDSFNALNIKTNNNVETSFNANSSDIKSELEQCLRNYKNKQQQICKIQAEFRSTKRELSDIKKKYLANETLIEEYKNEMCSLKSQIAAFENGNNAPTQQELQLREELGHVIEEKETLRVELEDVQRRLEEVASNEEKLNDINAELATQLSQVFKDNDSDKQQEIESYQRVIQHHYEDARDRLQQELTSNFQKERVRLIQTFEGQIEQTKQELDAKVKELCAVKEMYVQMCKVKDDVEDRVRSECQDVMDKELKELKNRLHKEKETSLEELRKSLEESQQVAMVTVKARWQREQSDEFKRRLEAEVALAKSGWFDEHKEDKQKSIEAAMKKTEAEWQLRLATEVEDKVESSLSDAKERWLEEQNATIDTSVQRLVNAEKDKLRWSYEAEEKRASRQREEKLQTSVESAVQKAKSDWLKDREELSQFIQEVKNRHQSEIELAVAEAKDNWNIAKQQEISSDLDIKKHFEDKISALNKEIETLKKRKHQLEKELSVAKLAWGDEKRTLVMLKDMEINRLKERNSSLETEVESSRKIWMEEKKSLIEKTQRHEHEKSLVSMEQEGLEMRAMKAEVLRERSDTRVKQLQTELQIMQAKIFEVQTDVENERETSNNAEIGKQKVETRLVDVTAVKDATIDELRSEIGRFTTERDSWISQKQQLETQLNEINNNWVEKLEEMKRSMETERKRAVDSTSDEHQRVLKQLVDEQNESLRMAREQFQKERVSERVKLIEQHSSEMSRIRTDNNALMESFIKNNNERMLIRNLEEQYNNERQEADKTWQTKLDEIQRQNEAQKQQLKHSYEKQIQEIIDGREKMKSALTEAMHQISKFTDWQQEKTNLETEVKERDELLANADKHLETEVEKLRRDLQQQQTQQLKKEVEEICAKYENEYERRMNLINTERRQRAQQLDKSEKEFHDMEQSYDAAIKNYVNMLDVANEKTEKLRAQHEELVRQVKHSLETEYNEIIEGCEREKNDFASKLELCQDQLRRLRDERDGLEDALNRAGVERESLVDAQDQLRRLRDERDGLEDALNRAGVERDGLEDALNRAGVERDGLVDAQNNLNNELRHLNEERDVIEAEHRVCNKQMTQLREQLKTLETCNQQTEDKHRQDVLNVKQKLTVEAQSALNTMKEKMREIRRRHTAAMEAMRKQHDLEKVELIRQASPDQGRTPSPVDQLKPHEIENIRSQYLNTVNSIRGEVLNHVAETNRRAAQTIRENLSREHKTAELRCMKTVDKLLAQWFPQPCERQERLSAIKRDLHVAKTSSTPKPTLSATTDTRQTPGFTPIVRPKTPSGVDVSTNTVNRTPVDLGNSKTAMVTTNWTMNMSTVGVNTLVTEEITNYPLLGSGHSSLPKTPASDKYPVRNVSPNKRRHQQPDRSQPQQMDRGQPQQTDRSQQDRSQQDRSQQDRSQPDRSQPDRSQPDRSQPDRSQPDRSQPDRSAASFVQLSPELSQLDFSLKSQELSVRDRTEDVLTTDVSFSGLSDFVDGRRTPLNEELPTVGNSPVGVADDRTTSGRRPNRSLPTVPTSSITPVNHQSNPSSVSYPNTPKGAPESVGYKYTPLRSNCVRDSNVTKRNTSSSSSETVCSTPNTSTCNNTDMSYIFRNGGSGISMSETGLGNIPAQPRPYNPPPQRLSSLENDASDSSSCEMAAASNHNGPKSTGNSSSSGYKSLHRSNRQQAVNNGGEKWLPPRDELQKLSKFANGVKQHSRNPSAQNGRSVVNGDDPSLRQQQRSRQTKSSLAK